MTPEHSASKSFNILIVDDTAANLQILSSILRAQGYKVRPVPSGKLALKAVETQKPDLILLDIMMPDINGFEVCRKLKNNPEYCEIPVIFISALTQADEKVEAFNAGGVDYVTKPFNLEEVQARVSTHLKLSRLQLQLEEQNKNLQSLVMEQVKELWDSQMAMIFALARLAESRDIETGKHLERVQSFCKRLSLQLLQDGLYLSEINDEFLTNIYHASPLHDIGKVSIPDSIMLKPARLTPVEFEVMKTHSELGAKTLEDVLSLYPGNPFVKMGIDIARYHHEKWDGTGYPNGLKGTGIPLAARIMAIVDVYDALRSKRCYKQSISHEESCRIINAGKDTHFEPSIVDAFNNSTESFKDIWSSSIT
ncbi:MAG TPA: HD domain-containing phosphohydrolase [Clostridia bacterium]|nr:HD domain-containing phosphohydrolase [Clostridia bacterium]